VSPLEIVVLRRKLARITSDLARLEALAGTTLAEWENDADRRDVGERRLQTCIEAATDLNAHLLVGLGHAPSDTAYKSFLDLAQRTAIIDADLARGLAPSAGLRNRLVHQYDQIDNALVLEGVRSAVRLYRRYVEAVAEYVQGLG